MLPAMRPFLVMISVGLGISAALEPCSRLPSWTFRDLNFATWDEVSSAGTASLTFTYDLTNQTETITCPLHSNYRCTITGTQNDNSTIIDLQLGIGTVYTTVIQVLNCGESSPTTFVGVGEVSVNCNTVPFGSHDCTAELATIEGVADFNL
ncbi:hypothetical protein F5Y14DRAFT_465680 [Nemania sp. NC0429]|nr:hypothetical protein F5Y14DRAFT_465680 [Nemania sp. NC0429]